LKRGLRTGVEGEVERRRPRKQIEEEAEGKVEKPAKKA
jgi:hypothetical protein